MEKRIIIVIATILTLGSCNCQKTVSDPFMGVEQIIDKLYKHDSIKGIDDYQINTCCYKILKRKKAEKVYCKYRRYIHHYNDVINSIYSLYGRQNKIAFVYNDSCSIKYSTEYSGYMAELDRINVNCARQNDTIVQIMRFNFKKDLNTALYSFNKINFKQTLLLLAVEIEDKQLELSMLLKKKCCISK